MIELRADFNSGNPESGTLASAEGMPDLRTLVAPGDRILLRDGEGNSCEGTVLAINPGQRQSFATCGVHLDVATWCSA